MRRYFSIVLIFFGLLSVRSHAQCSIRVKLHAPSMAAYHKDHINVLLLDENDLSQPISFEKHSTSKIRGLEPGNYQIVYNNKYGEYSRTRFTLKKGQRKVPVVLNYEKLDSLKYLGKRRIDSLKNGDSLRVWYQSSGCFHHFKKNIVYYRESDQLYATNYEDTVLLDSNAIQQVRVFETELPYWRNGGCTTISYYVVFLNGEEVAITMDDSCSWNGFECYLNGVFRKNEDE